MKKIIIALLVLAAALVGMSFVSASSDVDNVYDYAHSGDMFNSQGGLGPLLPHHNPFGPIVHNPNPQNPHHFYDGPKW